MARPCDDCGIAPWQTCQCAPAAPNGLDPADNPYQRAERQRRPQTVYFDADGRAGATPAPQPTTHDFTPCASDERDPF